MTDLMELASRVEVGEGGDRRLDYLVMCATVQPGRGYIWDPEGPNHRFTTSIDAAMSLVPIGADIACAIMGGRAYAGVGKERSDDDREAATLPRAITAACLRFRARAHAHQGAAHVDQ